VNPRVLLADGEPSDLDLVRTGLERAGLSVVAARDGREAVDAFRRERPDLIVLGARMPRMDGVEATLAIRSLPGGEIVPILIMTGADDETLLAKALEAGASDFATKPPDAALLAQRLRYMLRTKRTLEDLKHREEQLAEAQRHARVGHWEWDSTSGQISS